MKVYCVSNYDEIKKIANEYNYAVDNSVMFRGTSAALVPSIVQKYSHNSYADLVAKEHLLLDEFNKYSHIKYKFKEGSALDWEIRIAAREHGLASSLMDWSNSLDAAIEFAIHNFEAKKINYTNIWILIKPGIEPISIPEKTIRFNEIFTPTIIQFTPYTETSYYKRKFVQGGYFLKQPYQDIIVPLDKNPFFSEHLVQIIIPKNAVGGIWKQIASKVDIDKPAIPVTNGSDETLDEICKELNMNFI